MKNKTDSIARNLLCVALLMAMTFLTTAKIYAADGDLDLTFDMDGKVTTDFSSQGDTANGIVVQADGKILVAGGVSVASLGNFGLARYNPNGSLDASFDGDGKVNTLIGSGANAQDIAVQTDGKIVLVGIGRPAGQFDFDFVIARYNPNGSLDTTFNGTGTIITRFSTFDDDARAIAIQADGKIVVAGQTFSAAVGGTGLFALARYNPNGSLDTTFDGDGKLTTSFAVSTAANAVSIQTDGKIVAAGFQNLARYLSDGTLDTTFGTGGRVFIGSMSINAAQIQTNGNITVAGVDSTGANNNFALARINSNGFFDTTFGTNGRVSTDFGSTAEGANAVVIESSGKIVAVGQTGITSGSVFALARYNGDGSLDTTFSGDGKTTTAFPNTNDVAFAVALQTDGKIVAAGRTGNAAAADFAVARYESSGAVVQPARPFDFDGDGKSDISVFRPASGSWFVQRSTGGFSGVPFGFGTDKLTPADFDGDGKTDIAVYRSGIWYILQSLNNQVRSVTFGALEDNPRPADFDGDGKADVAVFRPSIGVWFILQSSNNQSRGVQFGQSGDVPLIADFDADGKSDITVFRPSNGTWFYLRSSDNGFRFAAFGQTGDVPLSGDFNGDGVSDFAVFRPSNGFWYVARPTGVPAQNFDSTHFGVSTDVPTAADYDGDGRTDIAVFRNGTWFVLRSSQGFTGAAFGAADDKPIPAAFQ